MAAPRAHEVNFDGLVGPTHNYAGLSYGNVASLRNKGVASNPRAAALEGLAKMKLLADLGLRQAVLPPHERPDVGALRRLGFAGGDADVLWRAKRDAPALLAACCSASAMWAANAATVSPSADAAVGRVHFTPANLTSQFHRSLEADTTAAVLRAIFADPARFAHHPPLPAAAAFGDEGAANHVRLAPRHGEPGVELFAYGRRATVAPDPAKVGPTRYPARQTREAAEAVARLHGLDGARTVFAAQGAAAIDAGVFHNDVICLGNENVLLYHAEAFDRTEEVVADLADRFNRLGGGSLVAVRAEPAELPLPDAVASYVFNSQLVTLPDGSMALIAPAECLEYDSAKRFIDRLLSAGTPVRSVRYVEVRQSMRNGGGPACLRLRVVLSEAELAAVKPSAFLTEGLYAALTAWVGRHYRDRLTSDDLADPALLDEGRRALDELTGLLGLGRVYPFQRP